MKNVGMQPARWRAALLTLCGAGALFTVVVVLGQTGMGGAAPWMSVWGTYFGGSGRPYTLRILSVDPGGPADRAGLHEGDLVDFRGHSMLERFALLGQGLNGRPFPLAVRHGSAQENIVVTPAALDLKRFWNYLILEFGCLWLLLFAALIAWRRPYAGGNLLLASALAFVAIDLVTIPALFAAPWVWPYVLQNMFGQLFPVSFAVWAAFASTFARPLSRIRKAWLMLCFALAALDILVGCGTPDLALGVLPLVATITMWFDPTFFVGPLWTIPSYAAVLAGLACSALAIGAARGVERQRAAWSLVPLAALYCAMQWAGPGFQFLSYSAALASGYVLAFVAVAAPLALTYVALNRRLIDAGFALNRTVVFAMVSTIVIGAFVLVEWAASEWFADLNHRASAAVGMVVALALGLSLRFIHKYVDQFVDHVFFRKRHREEAALRRFAHEAAFVSDRDILLSRAIAVVMQNTEAADARIFIREGSSGFAAAPGSAGHPIDENDPAIVLLRAWGKTVDLQTVPDTRVGGEFAFPMLSRGNLLGVLVCGPKRDGESYAPDETDALLVMARGVGVALDTLSTADADAIEALRESQLAIVRQLARVADAQDAIVSRLQG